MTRVLGIDPGSRKTGYGIIDAESNHLGYVTCGFIAPKAEAVVHRLAEIHDAVRALVREYAPDEVAVEAVFMHRNPQSALKLGQARGAAIVGASGSGAAVYEYSATQIKQATTGRGHAAKEQIQHMVRVLLNLAEAPQSDAADALAVAVAHAHYRATATRVAGADDASISGIPGITRSRARSRPRRRMRPEVGR